MNRRNVPPDDELMHACRALGRAMDLFDEAACEALGVGRSDLRALNLLEHGPLGAGTLADQLGLARPSVTALVDRLAAVGYVDRTAVPGDRRGSAVVLRPSTWTAFAQVYRPLGQRVKGVLDALAAHRRAIVLDALVDIAEAFDLERAELAGKGGPREQ